MLKDEIASKSYFISDLDLEIPTIKTMHNSKVNCSNRKIAIEKIKLDRRIICNKPTLLEDQPRMLQCNAHTDIAANCISHIQVVLWKGDYTRTMHTLQQCVQLCFMIQCPSPDASHI